MTFSEMPIGEKRQAISYVQESVHNFCWKGMDNQDVDVCSTQKLQSLHIEQQSHGPARRFAQVVAHVLLWA